MRDGIQGRQISPASTERQLGHSDRIPIKLFGGTMPRYRVPVRLIVEASDIIEAESLTARLMGDYLTHSQEQNGPWIDWDWGNEDTQEDTR